jgi:hypothetical protein
MSAFLVNRALSLPLAAASLLLLASVVGGQSRSARRAPSAPLSISSAEAEGAGMLGGDRKSARCAEGRGMGPTESGRFTIGGMLSGQYASRAGQAGKIWWRPAHANDRMPPLVVRGRNLTTLRDTIRFSSATIAWQSAPGQPTQAANRQYFFPSRLALPTAGRWLLVATSGANWGCFIVTAI